MTIANSINARPQIVFKSSDVDLKTVGDTTIFTPMFDFIVTGITPYAKTLAGTIGNPAVNLGTNSPDFDNFIAWIPLPLDQGNAFYYANDVDSPLVASGVPFVIRVVTADATATTNTQVFYITGFYV